jgi:phosphoribosylformylglycinamidine synthase PurS subunit
VTATRARHVQAYEQLSGTTVRGIVNAAVLLTCSHRIPGMARVVVEVMPKPEILDPQGKAVTGALSRLGFAGISVRQGKRFELEIDGDLSDERLDQVHRAAETLLANPVIETFRVRVESDERAGTR